MEAFGLNDGRQMWEKGEADDEGFFTLTNTDTEKVLTATYLKWTNGHLFQTIEFTRMAEVKGKGKECLPLKTLQEVIYSLQGIWRHYQSRIYDNDARLLRVPPPRDCASFSIMTTGLGLGATRTILPI